MRLGSVLLPSLDVGCIARPIQRRYCGIRLTPIHLNTRDLDTGSESTHEKGETNEID
jgi:hypothetical protein